jgi:hypothetical protein
VKAPWNNTVAPDEIVTVDPAPAATVPLSVRVFALTVNPAPASSVAARSVEFAVTFGKFGTDAGMKMSDVDALGVALGPLQFELTVISLFVAPSHVKTLADGPTTMSKSIGEPVSVDDVARTIHDPAALGRVRLPLESDAMPSLPVVVSTADVLHDPLITLNEIETPVEFGTGLFNASSRRTAG